MLVASRIWKKSYIGDVVKIIIAQMSVQNGTWSVVFEYSVMQFNDIFDRYILVDLGRCISYCY